MFMTRLYTYLEKITINYFSKKKAIKEANKNRVKTLKGEVLSWLDALLFAVVTVIIINQFIFQLFVIPTPSMVSTLNVQDRVVVSKFAYGIEPYPTGNKLFTENRKVQAGDIICFYNPNYDSKGPFFDILSQALYYATLSLVNIDRKPDGSIAERLYVKRAAAVSGDHFRFTNGISEIKPVGYSSYFDEREFKAENGYNTEFQRKLDEEYYEGLLAWASLYAMQENSMNIKMHPYFNKYSGMQEQKIKDNYTFDKQRAHFNALINPMDKTALSAAAIYDYGIYVEKNHILPLGDNRDNSLDGRYFGPVDQGDIIGEITTTFWPLNRIRNFI